MSKSNDEMREELARIRREEEQKALTREYQERERARADERAAAMDKLHKGHKTTDPQTGREATLWEVAMKEADRALEADVNAYNDWRSAMMKLWNIYGSMAKALHQSTNETIWAPASNLIADKVLLPASDILRELFRKNPEIDLPELQHLVTCSDDGKLSIQPLTRSDNNQETSPVLDQLFEKGVRMWLEQQGYVATPGDKSKFVDEHGMALDKDTFNKLKDDPDNGLDNFLKGESELDFRPRGP
ncbi:hydrolase [Legionella bononiensis]|uniref:hydrolase n=1 Tax=Legionella bononiensis TaxID=2793102 RepID=UPI001931D140|nr:hydrolase [Legionella bononiensis]MBL7478810.1 hydrolase [Legionella bononiensis]MBL7562466.1 hydrolase [Legionella bononiensis]